MPRHESVLHVGAREYDSAAPQRSGCTLSNMRRFRQSNWSHGRTHPFTHSLFFVKGVPIKNNSFTRPPCGALAAAHCTSRASALGLVKRSTHMYKKVKDLDSGLLPG
jgi:hypothetical protein